MSRLTWRCTANANALFNLYIEAVGPYFTDTIMDTFNEDDALKVVEYDFQKSKKLRENAALFVACMLPVEELYRRTYEDEIVEALRASLSDSEKEGIAKAAKSGNVVAIERIVREHLEKHRSDALVRAIVGAIAHVKLAKMGK